MQLAGKPPYPRSNSFSEAPLVSVIIINWNKADLTLGCIQTTLAAVENIPHEIIVVDNGSDDLAVSKLRNGAPVSVKTIGLCENLYFGEANNIGIEAAQGEFVLLLNNDATLTSDAVPKLLHAMQTETQVGAVGAKLVYPDGMLQEVGAFVRDDGWTFQQGKGGTAFDAKFERSNHIVDYCSAACLLVRRDLFLSVGGFDPLFDPAYFEDVDLAFRLRAAGFFTYVCADAVVYHDEHGGASENWTKIEASAATIRNHDRFYARWRDYLSTRFSAAEIEPVFPGLVPQSNKAADWKSRGRVLLCASTMMRASDECEGLLVIASALQEDFDITFAANEACSRSRVRSLCRNINLQLDEFGIVRFSPEIFSQYQYVVFGFGWAARQDALAPLSYIPAEVVLAQLLEAI